MNPTLPTLNLQFMQSRTFLYWVLAIAVLAVLVLMPDFAHAATTSSSMPWEDPLTKFKDSVTGPVAIGVAILAIAATGMTLIFGGEMNEFTRKMIMVVLVVSIIVFAAQVLTNLTGKSATIPTCENTQAAVTCSNQ